MPVQTVKREKINLKRGKVDIGKMKQSSEASLSFASHKNSLSSILKQLLQSVPCPTLHAFLSSRATPQIRLCHVVRTWDQIHLGSGDAI